MKYGSIDRLTIGGSGGSVHCEREEIRSVGAHWHDFYEIELVMRGEGTHIINGRSYPLCRGTVYLMRLTDRHELRLDTDTAVSHKIQIPPELMPADVVNIIMFSGGDLTVQLDEERFGRMCMLYDLIEQAGGDSRYRSTVTGHLLSSMILLFMEQADGKAMHAYTGMGERMRGIICYVQEHFTDSVTVEGIAEHFYLNKNYLCTFFKNNTGVTLLGYIRDLRLKTAARLAVNTDLKSIEICEKCGYTSISNFLRDFKQAYGVSPLKLRQTARQSE